MSPTERPEQEILDDAWTAWAQLLVASEPVLDEPALLAGIELRLARQANRRSRPVLVAALLAASVMVAVCWSAWRPAASDGTAVETASPPVDLGLAGQESVDESAPSANEIQEPILWDDEIGRGLALVRSQAWHVEREWSTGSDGVASVYGRMDDLEHELEESSL